MVLHAICNAITSLTHVLILGDVADKLCLNEGKTDSELYLIEALKTLGNQKITHVVITLEGKKPKFKNRLLEMRQNIARILQLEISQVGVTATSVECCLGIMLSKDFLVQSYKLYFCLQTRHQKIIGAMLAKRSKEPMFLI